VVSTIDIILAATTASRFLEAFILVAIALTIVTTCVGVAELLVVVIGQLALLLAGEGHWLLGCGLLLRLVGSLGELLQIRDFVDPLHGVGHLHGLLLHIVLLLLLHVRVHGHVLLGVLVLLLLLVHVVGVWEVVVVGLHEFRVCVCVNYNG